MSRPAFYLPVALMAGRSSIADFGLGPEFEWLYISALVTTVVIGLSLAVRGRPRPPREAATPALAGLSVVALMSLTYSLDTVYGLEKVLEMLLVVAMVGAVALSVTGVEDVDALALGFVVFSGLLAVAGLVTGGWENYRLAALWGGPNTFARFMFLGMASVVYLGARAGRSWPILAASVFGLCLILSGSRGAVIGAVCGAVAAFCLRPGGFRRIPPSGWLWGLGLVYVGALIVPLIASQHPGLVERYVNLLSEIPGSTSVTLRRFFAQIAWQAFLDRPLLGWGAGSFGILSSVGRYPHNLFLEVGCELGLAGLVPTVIAVGAGLVALVRRPPGSTVRGWATVRPYAAACLVFSLVAAQFSGDIYDSRLAFFFAGVATVVAALVKRSARPAAVLGSPAPGAGPPLPRPGAPAS